MTMALASSKPSSEPGTLSGMMLAAVAFALLTSVDTIFKMIALGDHPSYQILFVNGCFALIPVLTWSMLTGGVGRLRTIRLPQHFARGATSTLSAYAAIYAYSRLPLSNFYAFVFMGPLIVTALSAFWLGERIERERWFAVAVGLIGITVVTHLFGITSGGTASKEAVAGGFAAMLSVFCYSLSVITVRRMRVSENNLTFSFYGYLSSLSIGGVLYFIFGAPGFSISDIAHLAVSGTLGGIASICLMTAYHRTPVSLVAPFQYTQIIWGAVAGYFIWHHVPDMNLACGAVLVAASGLFVIYREVRVKDPT